ncbi:hypothetical protein UZ36_07575 [Candidatus Nitromaritima sp. SCGC AAA799-C22]|nr:hypothetical protein UZ36_07575 [Candidatus Nitromaritima sp. SCGC AAA799-C22]
MSSVNPAVRYKDKIKKVWAGFGGTGVGPQAKSTFCLLTIVFIIIFSIVGGGGQARFFLGLFQSFGLITVDC